MPMVRAPSVIELVVAQPSPSAPPFGPVVLAYLNGDGAEGIVERHGINFHGWSST